MISIPFESSIRQPKLIITPVESYIPQVSSPSQQTISATSVDKARKLESWQISSTPFSHEATLSFNPLITAFLLALSADSKSQTGLLVNS